MHHNESLDEFRVIILVSLNALFRDKDVSAYWILATINFLYILRSKLL